MSAACRGVPGDCPSTPRHSRCDGERKPLRYKNSEGDGQRRVLLSPSSHPPPATEAAAAATAEKPIRPPRGACRECRRLERCLNAACSGSSQNPLPPPRPTRAAASDASSAELPRPRGVSGYVLGFSIPRASRVDGVLQAHRGRLKASGVNQRLGKREGSVWVQPKP